MSLRTLILAAAAVATAFSSAQADEISKVYVSQIVEHPALDAARNGLLRGLGDQGFIEGENLEFVYRTAQGNASTAVQIARDFIGDKPDVLVGIATPSAQALVSATSEIPVVFSAVTDPVGASLMTDMAAPDQNVTGLSDRSPVAQHLDLILQIAPEATRIGVIYNPGESNSQSILEDLQREAAKRDLEIVESTALQTADVLTASRNLLGKVDFIYAPTDNTVAAAIDVIAQAAIDGKTPLFAGSNSYVERGALVGLGFDYDQIGYQTASYVADLLRGVEVSELPARVATGSDLMVNTTTAEALGFSLPAHVLSEATKIE